MLTANVLLDGYTSGSDYYSHHAKQGIAGAIGVGVTHAALSTGLSYGLGLGGEALGATIGTFLFPGVGTVIGGMIGGALGGWLGGTLGDAIADNFSSQEAAAGDWVGSKFNR